MIIDSLKAEKDAVVCAAAHIAAAARTAPKTRGIDKLETFVVTGDDIKTLSDKMKEIAPENGKFLLRDADNILKAHAVVMIGVEMTPYSLNCGYCGFDTCAKAEEAGAACVFAPTDLGIAIGSAVSMAADMRLDCRVMYSVGRAFRLLFGVDGKKMWIGIPLSATGKSPFFDRK